jgi:hypothetical protein
MVERMRLESGLDHEHETVSAGSSSSASADNHQ